MKFILIVLLLTPLVLCDTNAVQIRLQASDAVDTVLDLLNNLKQANLQQQETHAQITQQEEQFGKDLVERLQEVRDSIEGTFNGAQDHQKQIESQLEEVTSYLDWIAQRKIDIDKRLYNYHEMRCYSNEMFVKALKENKEAISVIDLLLKDLHAYQDSGEISLIQGNEYTAKLQAFSHLFNKDAYDNFIALGSKVESEPESLGGALINEAQKLKEEIIANLKNLEENEIQSAYDYAEYMMHEDYEHKRLNIQNDRKSKFQKALEMDIDLGKSNVASTQKALADSDRELQYAKEDITRRTDYFNTETQRRNEDNMLIDEIIKMFADHVSSFAQI